MSHWWSQTTSGGGGVEKSHTDVPPTYAYADPPASILTPHGRTVW